MALQQLDYGNPLDEFANQFKFAQEALQRGRMNPLDIQKAQIANALEEHKRQYEDQRSKNYSSLIKSEVDLANLAPEEKRQTIAKMQQERDFNPRRWESEMAFQGAQTNKMNTMTPLDAENQQNVNKYYGDYIKSQIAANKSLATQRQNSSLNLGGVSGQTLGLLQRQIQMENPNFTPQQVNEASSAYIEGRPTLTDGTQLRQPSGIVASQLDAIAKQRYTTDALNQNRYAKTLDTLLTEGQKLMPSVAQYSSFVGSAKGSADKAKEFFASCCGRTRIASISRLCEFHANNSSINGW